MSDLINKLNAAYRLAEWYREGSVSWLIVLDQLSDRGFYAIGRRGRCISAFLEGVRFEL